MILSVALSFFALNASHAQQQLGVAPTGDLRSDLNSVRSECHKAAESVLGWECDVNGQAQRCLARILTMNVVKRAEQHNDSVVIQFKSGNMFVVRFYDDCKEAEKSSGTKSNIKK